MGCPLAEAEIIATYVLLYRKLLAQYVQGLAPKAYAAAWSFEFLVKLFSSLDSMIYDDQTCAAEYLPRANSGCTNAVVLLSLR